MELFTDFRQGRRTLKSFGLGLQLLGSLLGWASFLSTTQPIITLVRISFIIIISVSYRESR
jgi:hypothetical protein